MDLLGLALSFLVGAETQTSPGLGKKKYKNKRVLLLKLCYLTNHGSMLKIMYSYWQ